MSSDTNMVIKAVVGLIAGLLVGTGHLNATNSDVFVNDTSAFAGTVISVISLVYLLEHQFLKVKADITAKTQNGSLPSSPSASPSSESSTIQQ